MSNNILCIAIFLRDDKLKMSSFLSPTNEINVNEIYNILVDINFNKQNQLSFQHNTNGWYLNIDYKKAG